MSLVLDTSVIMRWLFADGTARDRAFAAAVFDAMRTAAAVVPGIWTLEVANALARAEARGLLREGESEAFAAMLRELDVTVDVAASGQALTSPLPLARRYRLSADGL